MSITLGYDPRTGKQYRCLVCFDTGLDGRDACRSCPKPPPLKRPKGFAALGPERRQEIARAGGRAAQAKGTGHKLTPADVQRGASNGGKRVQELGTGHRFTSETGQAAARKYLDSL